MNQQSRSWAKDRSSNLKRYVDPNVHSGTSYNEIMLLYFEHWGDLWLPMRKRCRDKLGAWD